MAYRRRRYTYRRRTPFRRRTYRRYTRTRRRYTTNKSVYNRVHLVKRLGTPTLLPAPGTIESYTQVLNNGETQYLKFSLMHVTGTADFHFLYNEFKIRAIKISFIPLANVSNMEQSSYASLLYSALDVNGATGSINREQLRQYQTVKWSPYNRIHSRYFYPRNPIHDSPTSQGVNLVFPGRQPWISTEQMGRSVLHYGLYISPPVIDGIDPTEPIYQIECTYYLSFRGTR